MRTHAVLTALKQTHTVETVIPATLPVPPRERLRQFIHYRTPWLYPTLYPYPRDWAHFRLPAILNARPDRIHIYRIFLAPLIEEWLGRVPVHLDLDEHESRTRARIAALARANGDDAIAAQLQSESEFYAQAELEWLPRFDSISVSSEVERTHLLSRLPSARVTVIPNTAPKPAVPPIRRPHEGIRLLFAGHLGYYPNLDAVRFLARELAPLVAPHGVTITVVGRGATPQLQRELAETKGIESLGYVDSLQDLYNRADAAIVPIRAGGGTRIKILEAFEQGLPVIATTIGAEGITPAPGQRLTIADTAEAQAAAILNLNLRT